MWVGKSPHFRGMVDKPSCLSYPLILHLPSGVVDTNLTGHRVDEMAQCMRPLPLSGTLLQIGCYFFPFRVRIQFPTPGVVSQKRVQIPDLGSQALPSPTSGLRSTLPRYLLDFLGEVLGHDATFLLLLFVFAWKGEKGHMSFTSLRHPLFRTQAWI